jgi:hypothetical protein
MNSSLMRASTTDITTPPHPRLAHELNPHDGGHNSASLSTALKSSVLECVQACVRSRMCAGVRAFTVCYDRAATHTHTSTQKRTHKHAPTATNFHRRARAHTHTHTHREIIHDVVRHHPVGRVAGCERYRRASMHGAELDDERAPQLRCKVVQQPIVPPGRQAGRQAGRKEGR